MSRQITLPGRLVVSSAAAPAVSFVAICAFCSCCGKRCKLRGCGVSELAESSYGLLVAARSPAPLLAVARLIWEAISYCIERALPTSSSHIHPPPAYRPPLIHRYRRSPGSNPCMGVLLVGLPHRCGCPRSTFLAHFSCVIVVSAAQRAASKADAAGCAVGYLLAKSSHGWLCDPFCSPREGLCASPEHRKGRYCGVVLTAFAGALPDLVGAALR